MRLVDTNVLLYASDGTAEHHEVSRTWLQGALTGAEPLLVPWLVSVGFLRISTNPRSYGNPKSVAEAMSFLRTVVTARPVVRGEPDPRHLERVEALLAATGAGGNLVNDAHLAALALQHDATVVSYDNDFARFPGVRWERPAA